jgi:AmiR/NasT family two-component response regulator
LTDSGSAAPRWLSDVHAVVHQATGMISEAHGVPVTEALVRLRAQAFSRGIPISDVARAVLANDIDLARDHDR